MAAQFKNESLISKAVEYCLHKRLRFDLANVTQVAETIANILHNEYVPSGREINQETVA